MCTCTCLGMQHQYDPIKSVNHVESIRTNLIDACSTIVAGSTRTGIDLCLALRTTVCRNTAARIAIELIMTCAPELARMAGALIDVGLTQCSRIAWDTDTLKPIDQIHAGCAIATWSGSAFIDLGLTEWAAVAGCAET